MNMIHNHKRYQIKDLVTLGIQNAILVTCLHHDGLLAIQTCETCQDGLCVACGNLFKGKTYCADCYQYVIGKCKDCGRKLEPVWDNVGPDDGGAAHREIVDYRSHNGRCWEVEL